MNQTEASNILARQLTRFQNYADLVPRAESRTTESFEVRSENNQMYEIEVQVFWDEAQKGSIRVFGSISAAGSGAFFAVTQSLLLPPAQLTQQL